MRCPRIGSAVVTDISRVRQSPDPEEAEARLLREAVRHLPKYNAGLPMEAVRSRYKVERVAKLASNENPLGASPRVIEALCNLRGLVASYPDGESDTLKHALAAFLGVSADRVVIGNGSENLIELACIAYLNPGDRVLTPAPCFGLHEIFARMMGATVDKVPFTSKFEFDVESWRAALAGPTKLVAIANPSNPVGCRLSREQFRTLVANAPEDALLLIDEAYFEFARDADHPDSVADLAEQSRPWLVLRTFSKAYGLAGLRVGYGIASSARVIEALNRVRTPFNVNTVAQAAAVAALTDQDHVQRSVNGIRGERGYLRTRLESAGYFVAPSHANFLFFDSRESATVLAEKLLAHGVIVKPWRETEYGRFIRVSVGDRADSDQFLAALGEVGGAT
jgi:histidinol-phosphate aminotransferase